MKKIYDWIEYNRFTIIVPLLMLVLWITAYGCTPMTTSPTTKKPVAADMLKVHYDAAMSEFEIAAGDLERQYENQAMLTKMITTLASGQVTSWGALGNMFIAGGGLGLVLDNRRKNTVIESMKRGQQT